MSGAGIVRLKRFLGRRPVLKPHIHSLSLFNTKPFTLLSNLTHLDIGELCNLTNVKHSWKWHNQQ